MDKVVRDQLVCWALWLRQEVDKVYSGVVRARSCIAEGIPGLVNTFQDCCIVKEKPCSFEIFGFSFNKTATF